MTISTSTAKAGPYTGNGSTNTFSFSYKVFAASDLKVVQADTSGSETTLVKDSNYIVTLNADQNNNPGGSIQLGAYVALTWVPAALTYGYKLVIIRNVSATQETDITNGGGFYPEVIENSLDKVTMLAQQLADTLTRCVQYGATSTEDPTTIIAQIAAYVASAAASAASAAASYDSFDDRYLGPKSSAPTLDNDGNALVTGALYFDTVLNAMYVWTGSGWALPAPAPGSTFAYTQTFSGNGSTTAFTLSPAPSYPVMVHVFIGGVRQTYSTDYSISGASLTFTTAPISGTNNIFCTWATPISELALITNGMIDSSLYSSVHTWSGKQTFSNAIKLQEVIEKITRTSSAATGTIIFDVLTQGIQWYALNASGNWTMNFRGDGGNTLESILASGESITVTFIATQGATPYYNNGTVQVDGNTTGVNGYDIAQYWLGGSAPTSGDASSINIYTYTITKTGTKTFSIFASKSKYA